MEDKIREDIKSALLILTLIGLVILAFRVDQLKKEDKPQSEYELETWQDESTGVTMLIFKDQLGDVVYCEPLQMEMEGK